MHERLSARVGVYQDKLTIVVGIVCLNTLSTHPEYLHIFFRNLFVSLYFLSSFFLQLLPPKKFRYFSKILEVVFARIINIPLT